MSFFFCLEAATNDGSDVTATSFRVVQYGNFLPTAKTFVVHLIRVCIVHDGLAEHPQHLTTGQLSLIHGNDHLIVDVGFGGHHA